MLIDSHTHIYLKEFDEDLAEMIQRAKEEGVQYFLLPNIDVGSIENLHKTCDRFSDATFPMMGLHPCSVKPEDYKDQLEEIKRHLFTPVRKYWAVGEIGIDLHWDQSTLDIQIEAFEQQIEWAKALNLPIVIHVRESFDQVFEVIDRLHDDRLRGVFHCFTGTKEQAQKIIDYGSFKMGLGGVLTFKNGKIDQFVADFDLDNFILETDAPYLAPTPHRGKRNEPAYLSLVAQKLADCFALPIEEIARRTSQSCIDLFALNLQPNEPHSDHPHSVLDD